MTGENTMTFRYARLALCMTPLVIVGGVFAQDCFDTGNPITCCAAPPHVGQGPCSSGQYIWWCPGSTTGSCTVATSILGTTYASVTSVDACSCTKTFKTCHPTLPNECTVVTVEPGNCVHSVGTGSCGGGGGGEN